MTKGRLGEVGVSTILGKECLPWNIERKPRQLIYSTPSPEGLVISNPALENSEGLRSAMQRRQYPHLSLMLQRVHQKNMQKLRN
jgi:hypothetical protein